MIPACRLVEHAAHGRRPALPEKRHWHRRRARCATGKVVWFDVPPHEEGKAPPRPGSTRGVAYWVNGSDSRIFATNGLNLIALNAKTGKRQGRAARRHPRLRRENRDAALDVPRRPEESICCRVAGPARLLWRFIHRDIERNSIDDSKSLKLHPHPVHARTRECDVELELLVRVGSRVYRREWVVVHHVNQV
jgi:hypothetical protein